MTKSESIGGAETIMPSSQAAFDKLTGSMARGARRASRALAPIALLIALSGLTSCSSTGSFPYDLTSYRTDVEHDISVERWGQDHSHDSGSGDQSQGQGGSSGSPSSISDLRAKRDVTELARLGNGIGLYSFRYRWGHQRYVGVIAQEVARIVPGAVSRGQDGYLRVNYGKLGLRFETLEEWRREHAL